MTKLTYEDVKKEHIELTGADSMHISLGPKSTPEGVRESLAKIRADMDLYNSYSELEKTKAHVARLRASLRHIMSITKTDISKVDTKDFNKLIGDIFCYSDMAISTDADISHDVKWMELNRTNPKKARYEGHKIYNENKG
jgi:hypothetical protein